MSAKFRFHKVVKTLISKQLLTKQKSMRLKNLIAYLFLGFVAVSCIQDEAPNAEADIESCTVPGDVLNRDPIVGNEQIVLPLKKGADITKLAPEFTLTEGATIEPASGTVRDFTNPQKYTVTSQDKNWKKVYEVSAIFSGIPTSYHFEETIPYKNKNGETIYYNFRETDAIGNYLNWTNANEGFDYTGVKAEPNDYPTSPAPNGVKGNCVKLTTKSTGDLGAKLKMYIATGNLFTGSFKIVIPEVVKATKFGVPFTHIPTSLKGYYKYKAGTEFTVDGKPVSDRKDICDIYGVFYETDDYVKTLDGTNIFTSPKIISIARINNAKETDQWTEFNIPFITQPGKTVDLQKLDDGKYNLAIVFSSSIKGDLFEGAVGSTLYIDEVELSYTDNVNG